MMEPGGLSGQFPAANPDLAALAEVERGFIVGLALFTHVDDAPRLATGTTRAAQDVLRALLAEGPLAQADVAAARLDWRMPRQIGLVHPSWIARALAHEPPSLQLALVADLPPSLAAPVRESLRLADAVAVQDHPALGHLRGTVLGPLCHDLAALAEAPRPDPSSGRLADDGVARAWLLPRLPFEALWRALLERGAVELGRSLAGAPPASRARAMAFVGAPWAQVIARESAVGVETRTRVAAQLRVARVAEGAGLSPAGSAPEARLAHLGALELAETLRACPQLARALGYRLPAEVGRVLVESQ